VTKNAVRGLLRGLAVVLGIYGAVVAWGQSNRYPVGRSPASLVGTPGTYTFASGGTITIDAQGRVTAISTVTRTIATTSPLAGGGTLAADRTLTCPTCVTGSSLTANQLAIIGAGNTLFGVTGITYSATGPALRVDGLINPFRIAGRSPTPTTTVGGSTVLGTGPTCTIVGTDMNGWINVTTGTGPTAMVANSFNTLCSVVFNTAYSAGPRSVIVHPSNPAAAAISGGAAPVVAYVEPATTLVGSFPIRIVSPATPTLPASTSLVYSYVVIQ
jgi:hypothetical protein